MKKKYGIYLAYPPGTNLLVEGLGRYLIELLRKASSRQIIFVIACPSWMRESLLTCFTKENIATDSFELIGPEHKPFLLSAYEIFKKFGSKIRVRKRKSSLLKAKFYQLQLAVTKRIVASRKTIILWALTLIFLAPLFSMLFIYKQILSVYRVILSAAQKVMPRMQGNRYIHYLKQIMTTSRQNRHILHLYKLMHEAETTLMNDIINRRNDIDVWYCPTAFWPSFNEIKGSRLVCVPDVVLKDFAIGFSILGERYFESYKQIEKTIHKSTHFVTYSNHIKWNTLVRDYHQPSEKITVIPHGVSKLDHYITVQGFQDSVASTTAMCRNVFQLALSKANNSGDLYKNKYFQLDKNHMRFLFYASQFRPNKNIISLLRAYKYLLRKRFISFKLVLTGDPNATPDVGEFIHAHQLENDVLCLNDLTNKELAACYFLAELSINPSFSEGGCPFTFTESVSVNTPVVMARISVTEETITCPQLQDMMLFNPYDWQDMANRIVWGLENKQQLLEKQKVVYEQLTHRTWAHVVDDHITIFDKISLEENNKQEAVA